MRFLLSRDKMEAARERVSTIVDDLKATCLLLEGRDEKFVKMHDIIRDVAISIASKDTKLMLLVKTGIERWPNEEEFKWCRTLSLMVGSIEVLPDKLECPELRTLVLECSGASSLEVPDGFFKATKKLEVLSLYNARLLPTTGSSISDLVDLRMLCLRGCQLVSVGFVEKLEKLEILSINGSDVRKLSPKVKKLSRLRVLDIGGCYKLNKISWGIISNLSFLEELDASDMFYHTNFNEWDGRGNASIGELNSLRHLTNLRACISAKAWSSQDLQHVSSLIRFKICIGCRFGEDETPWETRTLKLRGIELIGGAQVLMKKAQALYLDKPKGVKEVLRDIDGEWFLDLKFLKIEDCEDEMEHLLCEPKLNISSPSPSPSLLGKLSMLSVSNCRLKYIFSPSIARSLPQLKELVVENCKSMVEVVGGDKKVGDQVLLVFPRLKILELRSLPNLISFYASTTAHALFNGKVSFPVLKKLAIEYLGSITTIWDSQFTLEGADSFQLLTDFEVYACKKLVNVVRSILFPKFPDLVRLQVVSCLSLTSIVEAVNIAKGFEIQQEAQQADGDDGDMAVFPKLESVILKSLPNLKSFCSNYRSKEKERVDDQLLQIEPFFNYEVSFPVLKKLAIAYLESITAIWDDQFNLEGANSFQLLEHFEVSRCKKLVNMVRSIVLPKFPDLVGLRVVSCHSLASIVEVVNIARGFEIQQEAQQANDDDDDNETVVFPQLESVTLDRLPNLKSFCANSGSKEKETVENQLLQIKPLFNKVLFPVLKYLYIRNLESITAIWDCQWKAQDSLPQLHRLYVVDCNKLVHLVAFHVLPFLQNLKILEVKGCDSVKFLFGKDSKLDNEVLVFPHLENVELVSLLNLKSFCYTCKLDSHMEDMPPTQALFTHEVSFPVLKYLDIKILESITTIWDYQRKAQDSFEQLNMLRVEHCDKLVQLVASHHVLPFFQHLEKLIVEHCKSAKFLFVKDSHADNQILIFPQIKKVELVSLESLKSFCYNCKFDSIMEDMSPLQAFFTHEFKLPCLEELEICSLHNFREIWDITIPTDSFYKLKRLDVRDCDNLVYIAPSKLVKSFHYLQRLLVWSCNLLEEIFRVEASDTTEEIAASEMEKALLLPQLEFVDLYDLPSLRSIYSKCCISKLSFSIKLEIEDCPILEKEKAINHVDEEQ